MPLKGLFLYILLRNAFGRPFSNNSSRNAFGRPFSNDSSGNALIRPVSYPSRRNVLKSPFKAFLEDSLEKGLINAFPNE
jgi:hypothetical protein